MINALHQPDSVRLAPNARRISVRRLESRMKSWRALHPQTQLAVHDLIRSTISGRWPPRQVTRIKRQMEDGQPWFWQRFGMLSHVERKAAIRVARQQLIQRGR